MSSGEQKRSWSAGGDCCWRQEEEQKEEEEEEEEEERQVVGAASTCNLATGNAACQTWVAQPALSLFFLGMYINNKHPKLYGDPT